MKSVERWLRIESLHLARPTDHKQEDHSFGLRLEMRLFGRQWVEMLSILPAVQSLRVSRQQIRKRERAETVSSAGEKISARSSKREMRFNNLHVLPLRPT